MLGLPHHCQQHHFTSPLHWLSQVLGVVVHGAVGLSILCCFLCSGDFSVPVHEYVVTVFYSENLRLQNVVTLIGSSLVQPSVSAVPYVWHERTSNQPCCSWIYFILKPKYFKLHLCNEESTTVFDMVSLVMLLWELSGYAVACCPSHYSIGLHPHSSADRNSGPCQALEAGRGLLNPCLPPLNISPTFVLKARSQLCEVCVV